MARAIREGYVPNEPLREAVLRSGFSYHEIALRIGRTHESVAVSCRYETAVAIARAIGADPIDVGV